LEPSNRHIFIISTTIIYTVVERIFSNQTTKQSDSLEQEIKKVPPSHFTLDLLSNLHQRCSLDLEVLGTAMEDQRVSFKRKKRRRRFFASLSTASLQAFSKSKMSYGNRWSTDYGTPKTTYWCGTDYGTQ
jgi:hypothetical protein